jgi:diguanylate cyclase (GGDEF)-like protein
MLLLSLASALAMWTTKYHHLVYVDYRFVQGPDHHLAFTPGPLYPVLHSYPMACMALAMALLLYHIKKWKNKYRKQLLIFLLFVTIPFITEGVYKTMTIMGLTDSNLYLTPFSLGFMSICLFLGVIRFNIFEVISKATLSAMEYVKEGFVLVDDENNYLYSNPAAEKIFPEIAELPKGESFFSIGSWPKGLENAECEAIEFSVTGEGTRYFNASASPIFAKNRKTLMARIIIFGDITDRVILMEELKNAAYMDSLTGIYNRKHFFELANVEIERGLRMNQQVYTAMLDLDFFKKVNDTYGHDAGDKVLKATAGIIRQTIRSYDLLGRYGGEEFVLLFAALDKTEVYKLVERIRENIEHSVISYEGKELRITCSIGLVKFLENDTLEDSIKKADAALYAAKRAGRNLVKAYDALILG